MRHPVLAIVVLASCSHAAPPAAPPHNDGPPAAAAPSCGLRADWRPDEMAKAAFATLNGLGDGKGTGAAAETRVLAWHEVEDARPLRIDTALLWIKRTDGHYTLASVYRHPLEAGRDGWELSTIDDSPHYAGGEDFDRPPTHAQLETFLGDAAWDFGPPETDYKELGSGVCADAWQASFGEAAWHAFAAPTADGPSR